MMTIIIVAGIVLILGIILVHRAFKTLKTREIYLGVFCVILGIWMYISYY